MNQFSKRLRYFVNLDPTTIQGCLTIGFISLALISFLIILMAGRTWQRTHTNRDVARFVISPSKMRLYQFETALSQSEAALLQRVVTEGDQPDSVRQHLWQQTIAEHLEAMQSLVNKWEDIEAARLVAELGTTMRQYRTAQDLLAAQCGPGFSLSRHDLAQLRQLRQQVSAQLHGLDARLDAFRAAKDAELENIQRQQPYEIGLYYSLAFLFACLIGYYIIARTMGRIRYLKHHLRHISAGNLPDKLPPSHDELNSLIEALNTLTDNLQGIRHFARAVGNGDFGANVRVFDDEGDLGGSLAEMRDRLRQVAEQEGERTWLVEGQARLGDLLRTHNQHVGDLCSHLVRELIGYTGANQAAVFVKNEDEDALTLQACYAYGRQKHLQRTIAPGEGLVGQTYLEGEMTLLHEVPADYARITSGLGGATPRCLVLVPLKTNDAVVGVLEMAAFQPFDQKTLTLLEKVGESVAATLLGVQAAQQTQQLLAVSQHQSEELRAQEEELRQNMEEMTATQEELARRMEEMNDLREELEARMRVLNTAALLTESDPDGNVTYANDKFCQVSLYRREEILGKPHKVLRHPDNPPALFEEMWKTIKAGNIFRGQFPNRAKDGSTYWVDATIAPVLDAHGQPVKYIGIQFDITAQKQQEAELRQLVESRQQTG